MVSCKDEDAPPVPSKLSFAETSITVNEADGMIEIELVLDKPALEDFSVDYVVGGTAEEVYDFNILEDLSDYGEVDFNKGETSAVIQIELLSDFFYEVGGVTIELKLTEVDSDLVEITRDDETEILIEQEDGLLIVLDWCSEAACPSVDLDLLIRRGVSTGSLDEIVAGSLYSKPEFNIIPKTHPDAAFGLSYTYYSGDIEPLDFAVTFIEINGGEWEPEADWAVYEAEYTFENINEYEFFSETLVVQTFEKSGTSWTNFSTIEVPVSGSRVAGTEGGYTPAIISKNSTKIRSTTRK